MVKIKQEDLEERRCKHPEHKTTFVKRGGKCYKAYKCEDYGQKGCIAKR